MIHAIADWKSLAMFGLRARRIALAASVAAALITAALDAAAGIVVESTRVVYPADRREVTINVRNSSSAPSLVQAWLDDGNPRSKPGESTVPFVLTPPLFRLDPTRSQSLRLVYTQDPLPADRESLFWLNVLDIPPRAAANPDQPNQLEMAFKHRMKVFFRPPRLKGSAADAPAQLTWKLLAKDGKLVGIQASNPTGYHVSLVQLTALVNGKAIAAKPDMVGPLTSSKFDLMEPVSLPGGPLAIEFIFVNDYGGNVKATASASEP
jgi:chaperone protein EcpD